MTDFRALCAELVQAWDTAPTPSDFIDTVDQPGGVIDKIRAALAEPEPEGPTDEELSNVYWAAWDSHLHQTSSVCHAAGLRAVLARWGRPTPQPAECPACEGQPAPSNTPCAVCGKEGPTQQPVDAEVAEVVKWLRSRAGIPASPDFPAVAAYLTRAADLLERPSPSQPIPVSERLPGPGDWVWHCYAGVRLWQHGIYGGRQFFVGNGPESQPATHWLPAHALPVPADDRPLPRHPRHRGRLQRPLRAVRPPGGQLA